jgi:DNA repair protein RadD
MNFTPRPYQVDAISANIDFFQNKKKINGIEILPTGSGKSVVIANTAMNLKGKTVVFQPSKEILAQNFAKFLSYGYRAGIYSASAGMKYIDDITFCTIGSVAKKPHLFKEFQNIIVDECFPYDTFISTEKGKLRIGYLVKLINAGKSVPRVLSYNSETNAMELKRVITGKCTGEKEILRLHFSKNVSVCCTSGHPFLTSNGWKTAHDLQIGDCILSSCPTGTYAPIPSSDQRSLLLGSLLGDGSLDKTRLIKNINRFRFIQGTDQKEYLMWKADMLKQKPRLVLKNGFAGKNAYAFSSKVVFMEDDKCAIGSIIENLNLRMLAIAWMDDGHLAKLQNWGSLYSTATSKELTEKLRAMLTSYGVPGRVCSGISKISKRTHYYIKFKKVAVENLCRMIAPYVHPSMSYKIIDSVKHLAGSYKWNSDFNQRGACVLIGKESAGKEPVYNIQVEDNETYTVSPGKYDKSKKQPTAGIIVHNCHLVNAREGMYHSFIKTLGHAKVLGLTATPYRLTSDADGAMLKFLTRTRPKIFNKVLYYVQNDVLFNAGHLAPLEYFSFDTINRQMLEMNSTGTDFTESSLRSYYRSIDMPALTAKYANRLLAKRNNLLVFCSLIEEANSTAKKVPGSVVLTGETPADVRDDILKKFKCGKIKCVINVGVLTTGFDYPELECVLIARSTMSLALYYQIVGRVMRPYTYEDGSKKSGWVVDLGGNIKFFGKIETMRIVENDKGLFSIMNNGRHLTNVTFKRS